MQCIGKKNKVFSGNEEIYFGKGTRIAIEDLDF